ncbi:Protein monoglycylase TTLL8 [Lamellibrachia satsuma]|nr:Protein monoglycylase TTLL8 [Lamellibrachia satsuma]
MFQSQIVRNHQATFIFTVKTVDFRILQIAQTVNHFSKNRHITTKSGLCQNLRNTSWFDAIDHHAFYPRCYRLDDVDECSSFVEDHRITTCVGFIKCFMEQHQYKSSKHHGSLPKIISGDPPDSPREDPGRPRSHSLSESLPVVPRSESARSARSGFISSPREQFTPRPKDNSCTCMPQDSPRSQRSDQTTSVVKPAITLPQANDSEDRVIVPVSALEMAMRHCERFIKVKSHQDIDHGTTVSKSELEDEERWDAFVNSYYDFVHKNGKLNKVSEEMVKDCKQLLVKLKERLPQFEMDGMRNIWIIKPGAKSRGRGIQCMDHLPNILKSCSDADGSMVVQKYIERPFLIYNTKFDIRQWFLVTSWKPLTIWFYKDCYLRFCSQEFTLDDYNAAIHLSNNSIQKHYKNSRRSSRLPADNTWTSDEFRRYLVERKRGVTWDLKIIPAMKKSILCSLLCSQEFIDNRKNAYELYGADFMLTEDLRPWLLEINSSPSMARTTHATSVLVDKVLEDLIKVVLDRKEDKNCDIGRFELIYRQATIVDPNPGDLSFMVLGRRMKKLRGKLHCLSSNPESSTARDGTSAKEGQAPTPHNWEPGLMKRAENSFF